MGVTCSTYDRHEKFMQYFVRSMNGRDQSDDLEVKGK